MQIESKTLTLGEQEYTVCAPGFVRAKVWKKRLLTEVKPLFDQLSAAPDIQFDSPADLLKLLPLADKLLIDGVDTMLELLLAFSPVLEEARAYIEENASDKQIVAAFTDVVSLADPFGMAAQLNRQFGRATNGTSSKSLVASGDAALSKPAL